MTNLAYVSRHKKAIESLFYCLKRYVEIKNSGIHGFNIYKINFVLSELRDELALIDYFIAYLHGEQLSAYKRNGEPVYLRFTAEPDKVVESVKAELKKTLSDYETFSQSRLTKEIHSLLGALDNE